MSSPSRREKAVRETSTDYTHPYRPRPVAMLNRVLSATDGRLDAHAMVRAAEKQAGSADFGPEFDILPLEKLCESVNQEARLTPVGLAITRGRITGIMANRLRAERLFKAHPEILQLEPTAPIFIAGLQRTGTTMLHRLLSAAPALRGLSSYEVLDPVPPSALRTKLLGRDPRLPRSGRLAVGGTWQRAQRRGAEEVGVGDARHELDPVTSTRRVREVAHKRGVATQPPATLELGRIRRLCFQRR